MSLLEVVVLFLAGVIAGILNSIVGSGGLVTFPAMLAFGYSPLTANMTNNVGVLPGALSGAYAYRRELKTQRATVLRLCALSLIGGLVGALLLLVLPAAAFKAIVPVLIGLALVLIVVQPWIQKRAAGREIKTESNPLLRNTGLFFTGIYGGYFGAAQGILLMSILGATIKENIQRLNSIKIVLAACANLSAGVVFVIRGGIAWKAAALIAIGSSIGGLIGAHIGRRLPAPVYRTVIVIIGLVAIAKLMTN
ncbi:MAG: sulfite exporter TauE/SafE family protein [Actinomycetota bacterium]